MINKTAAIIGAGFGGLSAAYDLVKGGYKVTVFDQSDSPGGLAAGFREPHWDWSVEKFYHHWFQTDRHMLGLIRELGWEDDILFPRPFTVIYHGGKFHPFDSVLKALLYPGLGWGIDKVRFGLVGLFLRLTTDWHSLEKTTVDQWLRQWAGNRVYENMWEPLVIGKFSDRYADQVNMAWMWARLHSRTTRLGTFKGGFQAFADRFTKRLADLGVIFRLGTQVERIAIEEDRLSIFHRNGAEAFDQILSTTSPTLLARIAPQLPANYLEGLLNLKSMGAVVMVLSLKHPISKQGYYWYNIPKKAGFPFLSLVEHTNFISTEHFGGDHIVYIGDYLNQDHEYFGLTSEELLSRFVPGIRLINPDFELSWVKKSWVTSTPYAQPIPFVNHSQNIPSIQTPLKGLYFASMSQVYPWDRGTNYAVEIARRAASIMVRGD